VNAETTAELLSGLAVVADRIGIRKSNPDLAGTGAEVRNRLEANGERCLIVFDNVVDLDGLLRYIPAAGKSQVVITSTVAGASVLGRPLAVDVFTDRESLAFLAERTGRDDPRGARVLAEELGHLPLALAQAAALIQAQRLTYQVYLDRLRAIPAGQYLTPSKGEPYSRGVAEAILLSIDAVTATDPTGLCGDLLDIISLLSPTGVSRYLLYFGKRAGVLREGPEVIDNALGQLADASLLSFRADRSTMTAHRLVTRVARERRVHDHTLTTLVEQTCELLTAKAKWTTEPWIDRFDSWETVWHIRWFNRHLTPGLHHEGPKLAKDMRILREWSEWCVENVGNPRSWSH